MLTVGECLQERLNRSRVQVGAIFRCSGRSALAPLWPISAVQIRLSKVHTFNDCGAHTKIPTTATTRVWYSYSRERKKEMDDIPQLVRIIARAFVSVDVV